MIVADQGGGIDPANHERIFERFERLGNTDGDGSGLGLYISRKLARAMGGDVMIESALGQARALHAGPAGLVGGAERLSGGLGRLSPHFPRAGRNPKLRRRTCARVAAKKAIPMIRSCARLLPMMCVPMMRVPGLASPCCCWLPCSQTQADDPANIPRLGMWEDSGTVDSVTLDDVAVPEDALPANIRKVLDGIRRTDRSCQEPMMNAKAVFERLMSERISGACQLGDLTRPRHDFGHGALRRPGGQWRDDPVHRQDRRDGRCGTASGSTSRPPSG